MKSNAKKMGLRIGLVALAAALMALAIVIGILFARDQALDDIRNETLSELETRKGEYDDYSIVLRNTSKSEAKHLAEKIGAELRITSDGSFATLTLTDGRTVKDIYEDDAYKKHISSFTIDYQAKISESKLPSMPTVGNLDELGSYFGYLNLSSVWNKTKGSGITVAVIDTGIDTDHPEFAGRISEYSYNATEDKIVKDYVLEDGSYDWSLVEDEQGHGTAVSGALAAASNDSGMAGVAPAVTVVVIKAECNEDGVFERTSDLVFGLYYAVERDVSVVNMSFGYDGLDNPFAAAVDLAYDSDVICVAAAGNNSTASLSWPAADEKVIGVGSLAEDSWELADYSNYGDNVDICAPGKTYTTAVGGEYALKWGTSLSAPLVSGAVALLAATDNYITFDEVYTLLTASSYDLGTPGRDWNYGLGAIDVYALVAESRGTVVYNMMTDELEDEEGIFVVNHTLQEMLEPERLYAIFDGWYYDPHYVEEFNYYEDRFVSDITLYAKWVSEADGIPYTYTELEDGTIKITSYTGRRRYISVPEYIDGKLVTSIGREAFYGENILRGVNLPSGITNIGDYAFAECSNLVEIEIPEGVLSIGEGAFYNNVRLSAIAFAGAPQLTSIGELAFAHCSSLTSIEIPQNVSTVDGSAFYGMLSARRISVSAANRHYASVDGVLFNASKTKLIAYPAAVTASYTVPEGLTEIGAYAFAFSSMGSVSLGGVQVIGESAFECSRLGSVAIPDSVYSLGEGAFYGCDELSSASLGAGLTDVSKYAFANCVSLTEITIPAAIKVIREAAFANSGISAVNFAEDGALHSIGASAFAATPVEAVSLPLSLTFVYESAFAKCVKLSEVTFAEGGYLLAIGAYAFSDTWSLTAVTLPDTLEELGDYAFIGSGLEGTVEIPASLEYLGKGAFASCVGLESIEVNAENTTYNSINGVVYTEDSSALVAYPAGNTATSYTLPAETKRVAESAVYGTAYLKTLNLNNGLTELAEQAIYANAVLTGIAIPDSVTLISRYALANNPKMTSITFGESSELDRLGYGALAYTGVTSLTIPKNVSTIAQGAFAGSAKLQYVYFASGSKLESISAYTFDGCTDLRQITFYSGSALTSIQAHGFEGLSKLTAVNFGDAPLKNIDNFAFRFCESLTSVTIPEGVSSIGRYAFYACYKLTSVKLPASIEHIGAFAFLGSEELELYFASETLPIYLDEDWDHGIKSYYLGVSSVETDGNITYAILSDGNVAILKYEDMGGWVDEDLNDYSYLGNITVIGSGAFAYSELETVILPETLVTIQKEAFYNSALTYVELPASVEFIGNNAFAETPIEFIIFADDPALKVIEQSAFENTKALTDSVLIPASVTTLGRAVFRGSAVCAVEFEEGTAITEIPEETFANSLIEYFIAPESVVKICDGAFKGASALTSFEFSNTEDNLWLGANAFYQSGLEAFYIPENLTVIEEFALVDLSALEAFEAADGNPYFTVYEGVLYSLDMKKIVTVPAGMTGSFTLPAEVEKIGYGAFEGSALDAVLFPEEINLLSIGNRAFFGAESITEIEIPRSVVAIDYYAFAYAKRLEKVTFAEGSRLTGIYEGAFYAAGALSDITVPDGAVEISDFAFYGCHGLTSLPVGDSDALKMIGSYAFAYTGISGELTIPESIDELGSYAFLGIKAEKITVPAANARDLTIGIGAFGEANSLTEITLPFIGASYEDADITWFGYIFGAGKYTANTTYVPEALKKVTVNAEITAVPAYAFYELATLEEISLPESINTVYHHAFYLTVAEYELKSEVQLLNADGSPKTSTSASYSDYGNYDFGKGISGSLKLAKGITSIGYYAFEDCSSLESVVIPSSVTSIGNYAFWGCSSLESVVIPEGVTSIGDRVFTNCSSLESVVIPGSVTSIGEWAFYNCDSLESVVISEGVTSIGSSAFRECSSLKSVVIPGSVTSIGGWAFNNCDSLESVVISDGVTSIGYSAFSSCSSLESIEIPSSVTSIGNYAFSDCSSLESIVIPEGVTSIGSSAFSSCTSLYLVENKSALPITLDNYSEYGDITYSAKLLIDKDGNKIYRNADSGFEYIDTTDGFRFMKENGKYKLLSYHGDEDTITLPTDINGNSYEIYYFKGAKNVIIPEGVTSIGEWAFYNCDSLESVVISEGVTTIGSEAFRSCSSLKSATIPATLNSIGSYAFSGCNISEFTISEDNTSFIYIDGVIYNKEVTKIVAVLDSVTELVIPNTVTDISSAFSGNTNITKVTFEPGSVLKSIGSSAFSSCSSLKRVVIPEGVTTIGSSAFNSCSSLESVVISSSVTAIGSYAFSHCSSLKSVVIPEGVTSIGYYAFYECSSLESIEIPSSVTTIDGWAFHNCDSLESVVIPEGVTTIGDYAFYHCSLLESVVIPGSVTTIGSSAFSYCSKLNITLSEENKSFIFDNGILYDNPVTQIIFANKNISGDVEIFSGVTTIGSEAFFWCHSLESVVIPEGVTSIGNYAFCDCSSLESVVISSSVTSIGNYAFSSCSSLKSVVIPEGVTTIGSSAFYECSSLESIEIPSSVTTIGGWAFYDCSSLESVVISEGVTEIGSSAFSGCSSLESIAIPSSVTTIGSSAFSDCSLLYLVENKSALPITLDNYSEYGYITINAKLLIDKDGNKIYKNADSGFEYIDTPDGFRFMKENGEYTLISYHGDEDTITLPSDINGNSYGIYKFNGAKNVIIPDGVTTIGDRAFYKCSSLESVVIPEGVTSIGSYAFFVCSSLESVVIPGSVTTIGSYAFDGCSSLKRVGINYGVTSIGSSAFYNCSSLEVIILPSSVTSIGTEAFTGTAYYNDPENWEDGALYIYRHLIKAPAEAKFFAVKDGTYSIATDAFSESKYTLKHLELGGNCYTGLSGFTNLETLVITELPTSHYVYGYFGGSSSSIPATLARVVLKDGVKLSASNSYGKYPFTGMSGITVYVEANEKDVRWDDNFEGWNNGNTVIYGDRWIFAEFYDNLGSIISKEIFSTSQVIRVPYLAVAGDVQYSYVVEGYDLDGDGIVDVIPATSTTDISAKAIVKAVINSYKVTVYDKDGETVIYEALLPYGSEIALPTPDEKRGYDFLGFIGFEDGMTVTGDIEFYTRWSHVGGSHTYADPVWLDPTCTDEGGYKHECSVCGEWYLTDKVSATGHSYELTVVAPTCEKEGYDLYTCACGESYADNYTDATGHSYGDWSETKAPTCTEDGEEKRVCSCGASETAVKPAHGHDYMVVDKVDPTCHSNGSITFVCKVCEDVFEEILDATEHIYEETARSSSSKWFESKQKKYKYFIHMRPDDKNPGYAFYYKCTCGDIKLTDQRVSTNTASVMNSCEHAEGVWGTLLPSTYLEEGIDVLECSCCGTILDAKGSPVKELSADFKFSGVALNLTEDINLIYTVSIPEGYESPYVVFLFNGVEYTVTDYTVRADGKYTFKFSGINPQCMGDNVCATLYATCEGELVSRCVAEYSVLKYCQLLLSSPAYSSNAKLVTLISDLLTYGANTQIYRNYKTDALVTDLIAAQGITLSPSVYDNTSEKKTLVSGEAVEGLAWRGAGLYLTNAMSVYFTFSAADTDGLAISFTINGREIVYDVSGLTPDANGRYTVHLYNVMAHEFDSEITASFVRDGVKVGQTLTYSVNSYVITADGLITDSTLDALIKSIYNYGKSVEAYRG